MKTPRVSLQPAAPAGHSSIPTQYALRAKITRMTRGSGRLKEFGGVFILRFAQIYVDPPCAIDLNPKSAYEPES